MYLENGTIKIKLTAILLTLFYCGNPYLSAQSKKERIEILNARVDSLNRALSLEKQLRSDAKAENISLSYKLTESERKVTECNSIKNNLEAQISALRLQVDSRTIINEKTIGPLLARINELGWRTAISNYYNKTNINGYTVYELDFSKEPIDSLYKYNVMGPQGLKTQIAVDERSRLLFIKYEVMCCPGDNNEGIIFPIGDQLFAIEHYWGMFGGNISLKIDKLDIGSADYSTGEDQGYIDSIMNIFNE